MFSQQIPSKIYPAVLRGLILLCLVPVNTGAREQKFANFRQAVEADQQQAAPNLRLIRVFSSADDVKPSHPILDRTLDIIAGPADPVTRVDVLRSPSAVVTDSNHRIFVADPGAKTVHVFDFIRSKYSRLDAHGEHPGAPIALAVDGQDNLYVVEQTGRTVLVYDTAGKFQRQLGKLRGGESYFDTPVGITIDKSTGRIFVSDRQGHRVFIMDQHGKLIRKLGSRGAGRRPGEFRFPTQVVVAGSELFVLDSGNTRIQVLDTGGTFLRTIPLGYADARTGLAVDNEGRAYVSDPALNQIQVFAHDGQMLYTFDPKTTKEEAPNRPSVMWVDPGDCLYVVDSQNNRVGAFQIQGEKSAK